MQQVIIGVDPHKLSATIEVVDKNGGLLGGGRFATDKVGYTAMRTYVKTWPERVWAVEGANGAGRPLAQRLVEAGERVVDVPSSSACAPVVSAAATPRSVRRPSHARSSAASSGATISSPSVGSLPARSASRYASQPRTFQRRSGG